MRKLLFALLTFMCFSCHSQERNFEIFKKGLKKTSFQARTENIINQNITITKPIVLDTLSQRVIENVISNEVKSNLCDNEKCQAFIEIKLGHLTSELISLKETTYTMFRLPRDVNSVKFFNFILDGNVLYKINLNLTEDLKLRIKKKLQLIKDKECKYQINDNTIINLYIEKQHTYLHLYNDEICNTLIDFDFKISDINFIKLTM